MGTRRARAVQARRRSRAATGPHQRAGRRSARGRPVPHRDCRRDLPAPASHRASAARPRPCPDRRGRVADDRVHPRRAEPGRRGDLPDRDALGLRAGDRPRSLKLGHIPPPRGTAHARQQPRLALPRPPPLVAADRPTRHVERIAPSPDGLVAKLNALALFSAPLLARPLVAVLPKELSGELSGDLEPERLGAAIIVSVPRRPTH